MRILIVAHDFPPLNTVAAHRPYSWARTWTDAGHTVHVLTTEKYLHDGPLDLDHDVQGIAQHAVGYLRAPRATAGSHAVWKRAHTAPLAQKLRVATRRLRQGLGMFAAPQNLARGALIREGRKLLAAKPFDVVVSTFGPEATAFAAKELAKEFGVPWLSDYRDVWFPEYTVERFGFISRITDRLHRRALAQAQMVSTVSQGLAERLQPLSRAPVWVCYNGFFGEPQPTADPTLAEGVLHIAYTGILHRRKYDPTMFFEGLRAALDGRPEVAGRIKVDLYGRQDDWLAETARRLRLEDTIVLHGHVPYAQSIAAQRSADLLLFVDWLDTRAIGVLTGKLFEYLASGRPILCITANRNSEAARLISECGAGWVAETPADVERLLIAALAGARPARAVDRIARYSRRAQAQELLQKIRAFLDRR